MIDRKREKENERESERERGEKSMIENKRKENSRVGSAANGQGGGRLRRIFL